jgi:hypothetical protein
MPIASDHTGFEPEPGKRGVVLSFPHPGDTTLIYKRNTQRTSKERVGKKERKDRPNERPKGREERIKKVGRPNERPKKG